MKSLWHYFILFVKLITLYRILIKFLYTSKFCAVWMDYYLKEIIQTNIKYKILIIFKLLWHKIALGVICSNITVNDYFMI